MATVGGDFIEVTASHPTLGNFRFLPKAGESGTLDLGGFAGNDDDASVTGSGDNIRILNNGRWSFEIACAGDMNTRLDLEKYKSLNEDPLEADWTFTHINGVTYQGTGAPAGRTTQDTGAATFTLKIAGGGEAEQQ